MVRVVALVEGATERDFARQVLAPHLGYLGVEFHAREIGKPGHKGGVGEWERALKELQRLLRQDRGLAVTTMFDLYRMPSSWPGREQVIKRGLKHTEAATLIEKSLAEALRPEVERTGSRFMPYVSLHEFEALLFSRPEMIAEVMNDPRKRADLEKAVEDCGGCEQINDRVETSPSHRIEALFPRYDKKTDGVSIAIRIGLDAMRTQCPHFGSWLTTLENLGKVA